jgi:hypothetical protein
VRDRAGNVVEAMLDRGNARSQAITVFAQPAHGLRELSRRHLCVELARCAYRGEALRAGIASASENCDKQRSCGRGAPEHHPPDAVHCERRLYALFGRICGLRLTCHSGGSELP